MKTIIAGSRYIQPSLDTLQYIIDWAKTKKTPIKRFKPDWQEYGKKAGILRNKEMADYADALIAIWDGKSSGTKHMIDYARKKGLKVNVFIVRDLHRRLITKV